MVSTERLEHGNTATDEKKYVLVVDDEPLLCRMLSAMLIRAGYETIVLNNGVDVLSTVLKRIPDVITLDVMMPDMSGIQVAHQLRSDPQTARVPIVFITALETAASMDLQRFIEEPDIFHLDKPFSREQLVSQLTAALQSKKM